MLPILLATAVPTLIIAAIAFVLNPKGVVVIYDHPTTVIVNKPPRGRIYVSSTWGATPEPFKYQTQEDPSELNPIFDELAVLMIASEVRMQAEIDAVNAAQRILIELGDKAKERQPV